MVFHTFISLYFAHIRPFLFLALFLYQIFLHNISFEKPYICRKVEGRVLFFTIRDLPDTIFLHLSSRYRLICVLIWGIFFSTICCWI